ncbi:MAG: cellulase family glycosylhydrolase [Lachnospiraceae bacterium]|nr:cellulase family glycosylhydrolase [Lachnospiraceae bacterium]
MKNRRRLISLLTAFSLILTMFTVVQVPVKAESFTKGEELEDVVFQVFAQDSVNYSWHVYDEIPVLYNEPMQISWSQDPNEKFGEIGGSLSFGFQLADNALQIGQSASVHFTVKNIKLSFAGMPEFTGIADIDKTANFLCKEATWGKTGNSVEVSLREDLRRAYPDLPLSGLVKSLVRVSCTFQLVSYERGEWVGPQNPDGSDFRTRDEILPDMGAGVSITNALDKADCTGDEITDAMLDAYAAMGIKSLYIPVNYDNHMNEDNTINEAFLEKVKTLVDHAISRGFYVILSMTGSGDWLSPLPELRSATDSRLTKMYVSLAIAMDGFGDHLLLQTLHHPVATKEPTVDPEAEEPPAPVGMSDYNTVLSAWQDKIVRVIRATGTNNPARTILLSPYESDPALIPDMSFTEVTNLALSVEFEPYADKEWDKTVAAGILKDEIAKANNEAKKKNVPAIITSFGALNKDNYDARVQYAYDFTTGAKDAGTVAFWKENGNTDEIGLISFADASYAFPIIGLSQAAAAAGEKKPAMDATVATEAPEPETEEPAKETTAAKEKETQKEDETQAPASEDQKSGKNTTVIIIAVVLGVVFIGAVIVLALMFKKRNGSFF